MTKLLPFSEIRVRQQFTRLSPQANVTQFVYTKTDDLINEQGDLLNADRFLADSQRGDSVKVYIDPRETFFVEED